MLLLALESVWLSCLSEYLQSLFPSVAFQSKCAVLSKACDYIVTLTEENESLAASETDYVTTSEQMNEFRQQLTVLQAENRLLWAELAQRGISVPTSQLSVPPQIVLDE